MIQIRYILGCIELFDFSARDRRERLNAAGMFLQGPVVFFFFPGFQSFFQSGLPPSVKGDGSISSDESRSGILVKKNIPLAKGLTQNSRIGEI
jgi:hypothetical protein